MLGGKIIFEPELNAHTYVIRAMLTLGRAMDYTSLTVPSWNQLLAWLREMDLLRRAEAA